MSFDNIKLEKGLYHTGKSFTQALESIDPSENYIGTSLEGLDAYQRQLKRFDIKVSGKNSDPIEKFFRTTDSAALFPEYVSRAVCQGLEEAELSSKIVATTTTINGMDYRTLTCNYNYDLPPVINEGSHIPETKFSLQENLVKLHKRGRMLTASYEAIKYQRLDLFTVTLKQIGTEIALAQLGDALGVIVNGDGNNNPCEIISVDSGELTYSQLIDFWNAFTPYNLTTIVASPDALGNILKLSEFRDAYTGLDFHSTGKLVSPFGTDLYKSFSLMPGSLIGLDKSCALEKVQAGGIVTDHDKLIDRQLEKISITAIAGFAKIYDSASKMLITA